MSSDLFRLVPACVLIALVTACQPPPEHPADGKSKGDKSEEAEEDSKEKKGYAPVKLAEAKEVDPKTLSKVVAGGGAWDAEGNLILEGPILLKYDEPQKVRRFDWTFDRDDEWQVSFLLGEKVVGERKIEVQRNYGRADGMWRSDYRVPPTAQEAGFDGVYIEPSGENGNYSIAYFKLIEDYPKFRKERKAQRKKARAERKARKEKEGAGNTDADADGEQDESKGDAKGEKSAAKEDKQKKGKKEKPSEK